MYKVVIVDDEEPVLESFSYIMGKDVEDFTLCGKARSGTQAVELIRELSPDLVFMDIQMPGIDGLEAIRQLRQRFPHMVFILATAYERFDIAQKAIPLGVFSYLVKPVTRKTLLEEFNKVKKYLDDQRTKQSAQIHDIALLKKTKEERLHLFLRSLMWRNLDSREWTEFVRIVPLGSNRGCLNLVEVSGDISLEVKNSIYHKIVEKLQYKYNCLGSTVAGKLLLFFPEDQSLSSLKPRLEAILNDLKPYQFLIGYGGIYPLENLHTSFSEAFTPFTKAAQKEASFTAEKERIRELCSDILNKSYEESRNKFDEYWLEVFNKKSFHVALGKMVALFTYLLGKLDKRSSGISNFVLDPAEEIMMLTTVTEWQQWAEHAVKQVRDVYEGVSLQEYPRPLRAALAYIRVHYQEPLQLTAVAEENGVTGSYLSRLFKEHLGTTFIEYLNRLRVNKAILLLEEKEKSIKEISYMVGYQDPNYFSRIFRKYLGVSPSEMDKETFHEE